MKTCPHCGKEYSDDVAVCTVDQTPLVTGSPKKNDLVSCPAKAEGMAPQTKWVIFLVLLAFLAYFVFPFVIGFCNLNQAYLLWLIPVMFIGWPIVGVIVAVRMRGASILKRLSIGILTFVALFAGVMLLPMVGISPWVLGFSMNFRLTKHPAQVQQWAVTVINRYESGNLATTTNAEYWAGGRDKIEPSEIPGWIQNLWKDKPSIGIATITENGWNTSSTGTNAESLRALTGGVARPLKLTHCVAFSWYLTGVLVGPKDFKSAWNPGLLHEISPGIYLYAGQK